MRYADAHLHTNPVKGLGARKVAELFKRSGGWFIAIVALPPYHYDVEGYPSRESYEKLLNILARECNEAKHAGLQVSCVMGLHPAEIDRMESMGLTPRDIINAIENAVKVIEKGCKSGILQGVGEVGRQHYRTLPHRVALAEYAMIRAAEVAKDYDCIIHLHLENQGEATVETVDRLLTLLGVKKEKVLFHHATVSVAANAVREGYWASIPGRGQAIAKAYAKLGLRFLIESDFIDDPKRPCTAQCPWEMVKEEEELLRNGTISEDDLAKINIDNIVSFYSVNPP